MAAATAAAVQAEIEATLRQIQETDASLSTASEEIRQAEERQKLRRTLDAKRLILQDKRQALASEKAYCREVDDDLDGPHLPDDDDLSLPMRTNAHGGNHSRTSMAENENFAEDVVQGEYIWKMEGFSWLESLLQQQDMDCWTSQTFCVGDAEFRLSYRPPGSKLGGTSFKLP